MENIKDFNQRALEQYALLEKQETAIRVKLEELQKQKAPLKAYLQGAGLIEVVHRSK